MALLVVWPALAPGLVLDSGDGQGNETAPADDPGWHNVVRRLGGPSVVYLGDGWVLTANHVGAGVVLIEQALYDPIPSSIQQIHNDDGSLADLLLFQIDPVPALPRLTLAASTPLLAEDVVLMGHGASRGPPITLNLAPHGLRDGFHWTFDETKRWGTNTVADRARYVAVGDTRSFAIPMIFDRIDDPKGTPDEAQAALGDSGGALFARADRLDPDSDWVLAGLLFTVTGASDQPPRTSFYGDITFAVDLSHYRERILRVVRPACLDGTSTERDPALACDAGDKHRLLARRRLPDWPIVAAAILVLAIASFAIRRSGA